MIDESQGTAAAAHSEDHTRGGGGLRSPAYALFEHLDVEAAAVEATGRSGSAAIAYEDTITTFEEGQIVKGHVTEIRENEVIIDVGFKSEGIHIPRRNFAASRIWPWATSSTSTSRSWRTRTASSSCPRRRPTSSRSGDRSRTAHDNNEVVQGRVKRRIKGGLVVDLFGVDAFLPGSQIALRQVPNLDDLIGQTLDFKIIKINKRRRNIVVSRRVVLEEEREELKTRPDRRAGEGPGPQGRGQEHHRLRRLRRPRRHRRPAAPHRHDVGPRQPSVRGRPDRREDRGQGARLRSREGADLARPQAAHAAIRGRTSNERYPVGTRIKGRWSASPTTAPSSSWRRASRV